MTSFNPESAWQQAKAIAYPRLVGTQGEEQAVGYIKEQLERLGYRVSEEWFSIGHTPWGFSRLSLTLGFILLLVSYLTYWRSPKVAFGLLLILLFLEHFSTKGWLWLARRQTKNQRFGSKNIIASLASAGKPGPMVYIVAHYDSKSQSISLPMRIFCLVLALGAISLLLVRLAGFNLGINPQLWFIIAALAGLRLMLVSTQNKSSGGLDNAGSVGVVLELARVFSQQPPAGIDIKYLFTGAEEWGLLGASHYAAKHAMEWDRGSTYFVNLDGVGIKGKLLLLGQNDPGLTEELVKVAKQQGIGLGRFGLLPGLLVDHIPFDQMGFSTVTLACAAAKTLLIHTSYDTISLVDKAGLGEAGGLIEAWVRYLLEK